MDTFLKTVATEIASEWGYLLYLSLISCFSLAYMRDRRKESRELRLALIRIDRTLQERFRNLEEELRVPRHGALERGGIYQSPPRHGVTLQQG